MPSLASCLKKLNIDTDDAARTRELAAQYEAEGMTRTEAEQEAVGDVLKEIRAERTGVVKQITEAGGKAPTRGKVTKLPVKAVEPAKKEPVAEVTAEKPEPAITAKGTKLADKAAEKFEDFGEVLAGAKKHTASLRESLSSEIDIAAEPLSKSFPKPDYGKLAASGIDVTKLAMVAQLRAEIATKPRAKRKVAGWAEKVATARSLADMLLNSKATLEDSHLPGSVKAVAVAELANEILPSQIEDLANFTMSEQHYGLFKGEKNVNKWVVTNISKKSGFGGMGNQAHFDTEKEAISYIKSQVTTTDAADKPLAKFDIWSERGKPGSFVGKKLGARKYIELAKFDNSREARNYIASNNAELVDLLAKKKKIGEHRRAEQNERVGKDYRRGENVTSDLFNETFGFRGVQFGNWVENDRRQQDINNAYDGLLDLADVLDIPPKAISLNGGLGLAFGARGSKGASAHFEPDSIVINLTKKEGAGSLAHEWWHSVDNYFARAGELTANKKDSAYITELSRPKRGFVEGKYTEFDPSDFGVRPEVYDAFKAIPDAIKNDTQLIQRANRLDARKTKDYWTTMRELTARSFERYVIDTLADSNYESDYLATILPKGAWDATEAIFGNTDESYPYPTDEEAKVTNKAYQGLFDVLETKETDKGVALFSLDNSLQAKEKTDFTQAQSEKAIGPTLDKVSDSLGVTVNIVSSENIPANIKSQIPKGKRPKGFVEGDTVYLVHDHLSNATDAQVTLAHELKGHVGVNNIIENWSEVESLYDGLKGKTFKSIQSEVESRNENADKLTQIKEFIAIAAERRETEGPVGTFMRKVRELFKKALNALGFKPISMTNIDLILSRAEEYLAGDEAIEGELEPQFSLDRTDEVVRDSNNPYDVSFRSLGEKDKTLFDKAKRSLKRGLKAGGLLPDGVYQEKIIRDSKINAMEFDIAHHLGGLDKAVKASYGKRYESLPEDQKELINESFTKIVPNTTLPELVRIEIVKMRSAIRKLSIEYMDVLNEQIDTLGDTAEARAKADLLKTIRTNLDTYAHRSYKAFDDKKWPKKVPQDVYDAAASYLEQRYRATGMSPNDVKTSVARTIKTILEEGTAYDTMEGMINESKLGAKDLSILKKRKDIAPEIRNLLGEYKDARVNFAKTITKMSRLVYNQKFLDRVKEIGLDNGFFFTEENKPIDANVTKIAADSSETYAPLNGLYTYTEIDHAFKDALGKEQMEDWFRTIVRLNGMVKYGKTILSPTTAARNWMSAFFFSMANGHFDLTQMRKSISGLREYFTHNGDPAKVAYLRKLKLLGVVYDTPYAGEMMDLLADSELEQSLFSKGPMKNLKYANEMAQKFYQYGDDFWKIIGFENEKAMLIKYKGMSESDAEVEAAERVRNTYPTYSMTGRFTQKLRRFPLAGTFVSFPAEIIRTTYHMLNYLKQDIKDSPAYAARKITGLALVSGAMYALQSISKEMTGIDDDEEEAVRLLAAPWQKNSNILFTGRDEDGNLRYIDLSFLDPYNYWKRPLNAMLRDQPIDDALLQSAEELFKPFFGQDIAFGAIMEVLNNKKETGGRIFNPKDETFSQVADVVSHLRKLLPGAFGNIERITKAIKGDVSSSGKKYKLSDEMAALAGWRATTFDPKTALYYRSFDFNNAMRDSAGVLGKAIRNPNEVSDEELVRAYRTAERGRREAQEEMIKIIEAAKASGMSRSKLRKVLENSSIRKSLANDMVRGKVERWEPSRQSMENIVDKSKFIFGREKAREIKRRTRLVLRLRPEKKK